MKIDSSVKSVGAKPAVPAGSAGSAGSLARPTAGTTPNARAVSPQLELSSVATHLQQMGGVGAASETFNAEKVAEIRQAISEGRFQINPERIASGLIDSVRDMLSQRRDVA